MIGRGVAALVERALERLGSDAAAGAVVERFEAPLRGRRSAPRPGSTLRCATALARLAAAELPLAVVTNKPRYFTDRPARSPRGPGCLRRRSWPATIWLAEEACGRHARRRLHADGEPGRGDADARRLRQRCARGAAPPACPVSGACPTATTKAGRSRIAGVRPHRRQRRRGGRAGARHRLSAGREGRRPLGEDAFAARPISGTFADPLSPPGDLHS